ncbi:unnamed protein product [Clonostachys rhizophaga]|uniref:Uncharacterized protein n=1 Tax=Clonostachys rhizophaga TaxID=160324 RepID=A0A9N9VAD8_9HYPO|nr:unnamed protein product [Clonostachys rhizophaga]
MFNLRQLAALAVICYASPSHAASSLKPSKDIAKDRAPQIFNSVHDSMRQWGSSLHHNGVSFFLATVPEGVLLYHGNNRPESPTEPDWLAYEIEHAEQFAMSRGPPPGKDKARAERRNPFFNLNPVDTETQQHILNTGDKEPQMPDDDEKKKGGWLHVYKTTRALPFLYIDGMSGGKTEMGTLDSQDYLLRNKTQEDEPSQPHRGPMGEGTRARELCELSTSWGLQGVIRMEAGFEIIKCDFKDGLEEIQTLQRPVRDSDGVLMLLERVLMGQVATVLMALGSGQVMALMGQTASVQMVLDTGLVMGRMVLDVFLTMAQTVLAGLIMVLMAPRSTLMDLHVGRVRERDLGQGIPRATVKMGLITRHHLAALGLGLVLLLLPVLLVHDAARMAPNIYPHGQTIGLVSVHDTPKMVPSILHHHLRIGLGLVRLLLAIHQMEVSSHRQKVISHGPDTLMAVLKTCLKIQLKEVPDRGPGLLHVNLKTSLNTHHHMALGHGQNSLHAAPRIDPNIHHHRLGIGPGLVLPDALKMDLSTRHQEVRNHGQDIPLAAQRRPSRGPGHGPGNGRGGSISSFEFLRGISNRYDGIGSTRTILDYSSMVSAYFFPVNLTNPDPKRPDLPRLTNLSDDELKHIRGVIGDVAKERLDGKAPIINWQDVADLIVKRYAERLQFMTQKGTSSKRISDEANFMLDTFIDYSTEEKSQDNSGSISRCSSLYLQPIKPKTTADELIYSAFEEVLSQICTTLFKVRDISLVAQQNEDYALPTAVGTLQSLLNYLKWASFKRCPPCGVDEVCLIPMWPFGTVDAYEHPQCVKSTDGRGDGESYWGDRPGPPPPKYE